MTDDNPCHCGKCVRKVQLTIFPMLISCNICGKKDCPRAADHDIECINQSTVAQNT